MNLHLFSNNISEALVCPICRNIVDASLAVPHPDGCEHAACWECWEQWLDVSEKRPCCRAPVTAKQLHQLPRFLRSVLSSLHVHCDNWRRGSSKIVSLEKLKAHVGHCPFVHHPLLPEQIWLEINRREQDPLPTAQQLTLDTMMAYPVEQSLSPQEHKLLASLLRRLVKEKGTNTGLPIYTGGRPAHISFIPVSATGSGLASQRTKKRRVEAMGAVQEVVAGKTPEDQSAHLAQVFRQNTRR